MSNFECTTVWIPHPVLGAFINISTTIGQKDNEKKQFLFEKKVETTIRLKIDWLKVLGSVLKHWAL